MRIAVYKSDWTEQDVILIHSNLFFW